MKKFLLFLWMCFPFFSFFAQENDTLKTKQIQEITLQGKKKPVEHTEKGIVLNVAGSDLEEKDNAFRVLSFAPNMDGLTVLGTDRIQLILNGKEIKINKVQWEAFLKSIDAKSIKNIEINDRPDASMESKYDAQIIINTRKVEGLQASAKAGSEYRADKFGKNFDATFVATIKKIRIYASGNYWDAFSIARGNSMMNIQDEILRTGTEVFSLKRQGYSAILNVDYEFNDRNVLSFLYDYTVDKDLNKKRDLDYHFQTATVSDSIALIRNRYQNLDDTHTFSLNYSYKPDDKGSSLIFNTDYATDYFRIPFHSMSDYYHSDLHSSLDLQQNTRLYYGIFTSSADYKKVFDENNQLDLGLKYSYSSNLNVLDYFKDEIFEEANSQRFNLYENIYAAYLKYKLQAGKFTYTFGVRNEYTDDKFSNQKGFSGNQNYNSFLPTAMLSWAVNKNNSVYFHLGKRIRRPSFYSYDPTLFFQPPNEYSSGNEKLKPVTSYVAQTGYTFKQKYSLILQYIYSVDNIVSIPRVIENGNIFRKPENAGFQNYALVNLSIPIKFTSFWKSYNKFNFIYQDFRLPETSDFYKTFYFRGESTQSFILPSNIALDLNFSYTSPSQYRYIYDYGNFTSSAYISVPIWKGKAKISAGVDDIFNTERSKDKLNINGIYQRNYLKFKTRSFSLSFSYYFKSGREVDDSVRDAEVQEQLRRTGS